MTSRHTHWHAFGLLSVGDTMRSHRTLGPAAVVCAAVGFVAFAASTAPANPRRTAVVEVVERVRGAVVNIHSERTVRGAASEELFAHAPSNRVDGMGTGIIIDPRGYIITNQHVVDDVNVIRVHLSDGSSHSAPDDRGFGPMRPGLDRLHAGAPIRYGSGSAPFERVPYEQANRRYFHPIAVVIHAQRANRHD